jgi:hypothetical protein
MSASQGTWREPYFADADGREWHVYDTAKVKAGRKDMGLGSPDATHRVFVAADRTELVCTLGADRREITAELLARQLKEAKTSAAWARTFHPVRRARR